MIFNLLFKKKKYIFGEKFKKFISDLIFIEALVEWLKLALIA